MINRGYASGQLTNSAPRDSNEPAFGGANQSNSTGVNNASSNINSVQNAVATLLGEGLESQDNNTRAMLMNLVRQEAIEEDQSFESDNQWLSRSEQSSPSSISS